MQDELDGEAPEAGIVILGLNEVGHESGNPEMVDGRDLPWLQDSVEQLVWASWAVTFRDVVILDRDNVPVAVFNLTEHNLSVASEYAALKQLLLDIATLPP